MSTTAFLQLSCFPASSLKCHYVLGLINALFVPTGVSVVLQSPIRSRGRLPVGLGSSNEIPRHALC